MRPVTRHLPAHASVPRAARRVLAALVAPVALASIPAIATVAAPRPAAAQDAMDARSVAHLRERYLADLDTVHVKIVALARAIPEERYGWRPAPGVRSVAETLMHVASEWYYWTPMSVGGQAPADFGAPREAIPRLERIAAKAEVLAQLEQAWAHTRAQLEAMDPAQRTGRYPPWNRTLAAAALGMSGDLHEHLGQLIAYARSVGVTPPWSR